jgi:RNA polymerase sigma factor (sigma-70 family)
MRMLTGFMRTSPRPEDEFRDLIDRRGARMQAACLRITRDPALAEDAVQEALLKAWRARDQFRGEAERDTWLHRIAINAALELVRRRGPMADLDVDAPEYDTPGSDDPAQMHLRTAFGVDTGAAKALDRPDDARTRLLRAQAYRAMEARGDCGGHQCERRQRQAVAVPRAWKIAC